mmetsp:Transcript_14017/g.46305  ORF Transcript_14017/g.46305 Transcript_14017/m.46305 type:complete len:276 (-) Transcript_14017:329-1156(-)
MPVRFVQNVDSGRAAPSPSAPSVGRTYSWKVPRTAPVCASSHSAGNSMISCSAHCWRRLRPASDASHVPSKSKRRTCSTVTAAAGGCSSAIVSAARSNFRRLPCAMCIDVALTFPLLLAWLVGWLVLGALAAPLSFSLYVAFSLVLLRTLPAARRLAPLTVRSQLLLLAIAVPAPCRPCIVPRLAPAVDALPVGEAPIHPPRLVCSRRPDVARALILCDRAVAGLPNNACRPRLCPATELPADRSRGAAPSAATARCTSPRRRPARTAAAVSPPA